MIPLGILASSIRTETSVEPTLPTAIGEPFGGGFYIGNITIADGDEDDGEYVVIMAGLEGQVRTQWKTIASDSPGSASSRNGRQNTAAVLPSIADHPAAKHCVEYSGGGHADWYLPAYDEFMLAWANRASLAHLNIATSGYYYWTSTQYAPSVAWAVWFDNGGRDYITKTNTNFVRPVRRVKRT